MGHPLRFPVAVAQMVTAPGNIRANLAKMLAYLYEARERGVKLVVFPELAVSGYMLGDRWEHDEFIFEIQQANEAIRAASQGLVVIWGSIRADVDRNGEDGRLRKYNAALIAQDGEFVSNGTLKGWIPKTLLPKYRIFDDARHFFSAVKLADEMGRDIEDILRPFKVTIDGQELSIAIAVCEDLWEEDYNLKPTKLYIPHQIDLLVDVSQSPWTYQKRQARDRMLRSRAADVGVPILYANSVGLQNNGKNLVWFDGSSAIMGARGEFLWHAPLNRAGLFSYTFAMDEDGQTSEDIAVVDERPKGIGEIFEATVAAMRAFYGSFPRVVIGLSGGVDSALAAALLVEALGPEKVLAINMPTKFNSQTTRGLAEQCATNLGIEYRVHPIQGLVDAALVELERIGCGNPSDWVLENLQARLRGNTLANIAASKGGVFTSNGNKTETALNYFTLYGDGAGAACFLADLWKGQVYELVRYINVRAGRALIPQGIIDIVPSAELSADQNVDEGKGDPIFYEYHDNLLRMFIERRMDPTVILEMAIGHRLENALGCPAGTIHRRFPTRQAFVDNLEWCWRQYNVEHKRVQLPPVFIISRRAFGFDRRDTIEAAYFSERYYDLKAKYLDDGKAVLGN